VINDLGVDNIAELTWETKPEAIVLARKYFAKDPERFFGLYVTTMYNFRHDPDCITALIEQYPELIRRLQALVAHPEQPNLKKWTDQVDTFSTHLEWLSRRQELDEVAREHARFVANDAVNVALLFIEHKQSSEHTHALLRLTWALMLLNEGQYKVARANLRNAYKRAWLISDSEQRSRVYKKIVRLALMARMPVLALRAGIWWLRTKRR
jgi:hypothetical protein